MKKTSKLFELGEAMRKASIAAYDINRSIQKLAKSDPVTAHKFEVAAIEGLLDQLRASAPTTHGSQVAPV